MLNVTDTTAQQTFASSKSINLIPQVYAEWNYNTFYQPSITASTSTTEAVSNATLNTGLDLTSAGAWSGSGVSAGLAAGLGRVTGVRPTPNCIKFTMSGYSTQLSTVNKIKVSATAQNKFYKMVFWVKSSGFQTYGLPGTPTSVQVDASTGSGAYTYYYRVVPIGSNGQSTGLDYSVSPTDEYVFAGVPNTTIVFKITTTASAAAYKIYRSTTSADPNPVYIGTVGNSGAVVTVTDVIANTPINQFAPSNFTNEVYISPQIVFYNNATVTYGTYNIKTFKNTSSETFAPEGTIVADPIEWQKVEIWFGTNSDYTSQVFDRVHLLLNASADYQNASFYVDNIQVYEVTEFDYIANSYFPTDSAFMAGRPGESLLNPNLPNTSDYRYINSGKWNKTKKPCSLVAENPMVILNDVYPYKQYVPSIYDRYKYNVTQPGLAQPAIQAQYDNYMSINKLVIKFNTAFSSLTQFNIVFSLNTGDSTVSVQSTSAIDNGIMTLYYNGSTWSQTPWTTPPQLTSTGQLQNVYSNVKGIKIYASTNLVINTKFNAADAAKYSKELTSLGWIEVSPRLEIDITPLVLNLSVTKEITQEDNGLPLGTISSNDLALSISNIPVTYNSSPFTIFDNTSKEATFYNLMRQGVKFTCAWTSPLSSFTGTIPAGVFYSDGWDINDIEAVSVNAFDASKYLLMAIPAPHYSATNAGLVEIVSDLFNMCGFNDYNYDSLVNAVDQKTKISYFWSDEQKTVFEVLQDLFVSHQMGAFFDEYGILQFISLKTILNEYSSSGFTPDFLVTDTDTTVNSIAYAPNIIPSSYTENIGAKVGKVTINYKTANTQYSDNVGDQTATVGIMASKVDTARTIWQEETESALACSQISKSINPQDNYFYFDPTLITDMQRTIGSNFGDAFIGSEAISYEGLEYVFFPSNMSDITIRKTITNPADIEAAILEIKQYLSLLNINFKSINYYPTGKVLGVKRGKFNTPVQNHFVFDSSGTIGGTTSPSGYFNYYSMDASGNLTTATSGVKFSYGNAKISSGSAGQSSALSPNENSVNYNYFATSFKCSARHANTTNIGMFFGYVSSGSTAWYLTLSKPSPTQTGTKVVLGYGGPNQNAQNLQTSGTTVANQILGYDVYDGAEHRISIYITSPYVYIYIDGKQITKLKITSNLASLLPNSTSKFGSFVQLNPATTGIASATFTEIYAANFPIASYLKKRGQFVNFPRYHFQSEVFLNNIVHGIPNLVSHYLWQSKPQIRGIKFYDVKHSLSPALPNTAALQKVFYGQANASASGTSLVLERTNAWDVSYSPIAMTPFRSRFIAVNNSNQLVWLKAPGDKIGDLSIVPLQIIANYQQLSDQKMVERVIDKKYANTSVQLNTDWVQGEYDAYRILADITRLLGGFHRDVHIKIFGNPLIQLGDFVQMKYNLKRIGTADSVYYYVKGITQAFDSNGLSTSLVIKPMILS